MFIDVLMHDGMFGAAGSKFENDKLVCGPCVTEKGTTSDKLVAFIDEWHPIVLMCFPNDCRAKRT